MSLELIIGPMFAGKSTSLIQRIRRYQTIGKKVVIINHIWNNRYDSNQLITHDQEQVHNCILLEHLTGFEKREEFTNSEIIVIEELQFFSDAYENIIRWCDEGKHVVAAGLDGDYKREPFGDVLRLIPHAEKITKINALCKRCGDGTVASFTKKKDKENNDSIQIGSNEYYEAVCRKHYLL
jgi:thymidine kinase